MGLSAFILRNHLQHTPQQLLGELAIVCFETDVMFSFHNHKIYNKNGQLSSVDVNIMDQSYLSSVRNHEDNGKEFILYVNAVQQEELARGDDLEFDWLIPNGRLCKVAFIEDVRENNEQLIFRFFLKYLERNQQDFLWFGDRWAFNFNSLNQIKQSLPMNWYSRKPANG